VQDCSAGAILGSYWRMNEHQAD